MPKSPCLVERCPNLATYRGRCSLHSKQNDRSISRAGKQTYGKKRWRLVRNAVFGDEPFCRECMKEGRETLATCVDHIIPIQDGGDKYARSNLQPLCDSCHSVKTRQEQLARKQ